jgi:cytochrome c
MITVQRKIRNLGLAFTLVFISLIAFSCKESSNDSGEKPEDNRFTKVVLTEGMDEPMEITFLPEKRILFVERKGAVKVFDEKTGEMTQVGFVPVNTKYTNKAGVVREAEEGLMGVIADPNYAQNNWIYMYYADPDIPKHVLARWELRGNELIDSSKIILLEVPTQREECCHTGGGMVFDKDGNLYLTTGNNTVNPREGTSNLDERPGHENSDDQRAPSNTNDLRGKILRIKPEADGTYSIPAGNLFPVGMEKTRPEIYTMGHRNPWRPTLDSKTGYLYWGEVGPDAVTDSIWGPMGYDEFNQAKGPGFFGWPYFIGDNQAYTRHDYETNTYGEPYDVNNPVNESVNNTGLRELPPPIPAMIWYPYGLSEEFPMLGSSGRSATGGPVFRKADFKKDAPYVFPSYYEGKWLIVDFMRGWIMAVTMDENGDYLSMERFLPEENFSSAIDMDFGPDGALYVLEYGSAWFRGNANSRIVKIEYNGGNRKPNVMATADKKAGSIPFTANLSSEGTIDYDAFDQGKLQYEWKITGENGGTVVLKEPNPSYTFQEKGIYEVSLKVTDTKGESNSAGFQVFAGNEPPKVAIDFTGNRTFYFGQAALNYTVSVEDKEDGSTADGRIKAEEVAITFDYVPSGFDPIEVASKQSGAETMAVLNIGKNLIDGSDCKSCHQLDKTSIGPSYTAVAERYPRNDTNMSYLADKILNGGSGVWGDHGMSAHPELSESDARRMVDYILSINETQPTVSPLPLSGVLNPKVPEGEDGLGGFLLRASYSDKGSGAVSSLSGVDIVALRNPFIDPQSSAIRQGVNLMTTPNINFFMVGDQAYIGFEEIDLTEVEAIALYVNVSPRNGAVGGYIEARIGSPEGELIGQSEKMEPINLGFRRPPAGADPIQWRRENTPKAQIDLKKTNGFQDVYFIFRNPGAKKEDILMSISEIQFSNTPFLN